MFAFLKLMFLMQIKSSLKHKFNTDFKKFQQYLKKKINNCYTKKFQIQIFE